MDKNQVCNHCGKQLKYVACGTCDGQGYYREWIIFKKECEVCSGSGMVSRCPDEHQHIIENLNLSPRSSTKPLYRNFQKSALPKIPSKPKIPLPTKRPTPPKIPPPWLQPFNPLNPNSPNNPNNPMNPMSPRNPNNPMNPNNPNSPLNPNNPIHRKPFK